MNLRYLIIKVLDIERATEFYTRFLQMTPTKREGERMVVFDLKNIKIGLYNPHADGLPLSKNDFGSNYYAAFGVEDVTVEKKRIEEFAEVLDHHKIGRHEWVLFKDTEGNVLEIHKI